MPPRRRAATPKQSRKAGSDKRGSASGRGADAKALRARRGASSPSRRAADGDAGGDAAAPSDSDSASEHAVSAKAEDVDYEVSTDDSSADGGPSPTGPARRVAIIGGGPSGLTTAKACIEEGHAPVIFEQDSDYGGLWRFSEKEGHSSVYRSTVINSSKEYNCFSDFPIPNHYPPFLHHTQLMEYFRSYARHFDLEQYLRLSHQVVRVERGELGGRAGWLVTYKHGGRTRTAVFDAVAVCSGHHWSPNRPTFAGMDNFKGRQMHSHSYKDHHGFEGKNVVVVGIGNSGVDIAVELSRVAKSVHLSTRSGAWIFKRHSMGVPIDHIGNTRLIASLGVTTLGKIAQGFSMLSFGNLSTYGLTPKHNILAAHPTINDGLIPCITQGSVQMRPNISKLTSKTVCFEDGTEVDADVVIYSTGYNVDFPFLDASSGVTVVDNHVDLYKYVWPTSTDPDHPLAVIGLIQPLGSIMPISELQSRWFAQVVSGNLRLPSERAMLRDNEAKAAAMRKRYRASARHTIQVDYLPYCDEIASQIGAKPSVLPLLVRDPRLAFAVVAAPAIPSQYRLAGPHPWRNARQAILDLTKTEAINASMQTRKISRLEDGQRLSCRFRTMLWLCGGVSLIGAVVVVALLSWFVAWHAGLTPETDILLRPGALPQIVE